MKLYEKKSFILYLILALMSLLGAKCPADEIVGDVRVQVLSPTLVRIELKGPQGFEDRPTFHITERNWPGAAVDTFLIRRL